MVTYTNFFSAMIFIAVLLGLMDFSDIVILFNTPNSCYQQNLKSFDMALSLLFNALLSVIILRFVFMKERLLNKFKYVLQTSASWLRPIMSNMY